MKKKLLTGLVVLSGLFMSAVPAFAHVKVSPDTVGVAASQLFTVNVPNEKDNPTTSLRLVVPEGLESVMPIATAGWSIDVKKSGDGEDAKVTEITWSGGTIPSGQRGLFQFQATAPADETTLHWRNYQTYQDGSVVSWDQDVNPDMTDEQKEEMEKTGKGPDSETKIVNDLKDTSQDSSGSKPTEKDTSLPLILSLLALVAGGVSIWMQVGKKRK